MTGNVNAALLQELAQELGVDPGYLEKDWVLTEIIRALASSDIGEQLVLKGGQALRHIYGSLRLSKDVDDLYDLWYIFTQLESGIDREQIVRLLPEKFRPPLVSGGWNRGRLYERLHDESAAWEATLHAYVPQPPAFDDALLVVERALRFLPSK